MADITWPTEDNDPAWAVEQYTEAPEWDVEITYSRSGKIYTRALPGMRWVVQIQFPPVGVAYLAQRRKLEALLMSLRGGANRLLLWHLLTPTPLGTLSGTPTVNGTALAGASTLNITGAPGLTLLRGDRIAFGSGGQRVMVTEDASLNGAVVFEPQLRADVTSGTAVVWNKPTSRYVLRQPMNEFPAQKTVLPGFSIELVEE